MPDITKRPFISSTFTFGHDKPTSLKSNDSQLRANALSLSHDQLQSVVTQLIQFHPSSKAAIAPLIASTSAQTSATLDDSQSKHFATKVKNCKYWLSDTWWAGHPSLPDGYACQVSRKAVRKEVGDIMTIAKPAEFKLQKTHEQCEIILDAIVALIDIAQAVLRRKGTPSGYCRSDRSLGQHIGEQLYDLIYTTSSATHGRLYAHEDCIWEHVLVPSMEPHPARVAIAALAEMPPAPSNDDLFLYRTLRPVLSRVALDVKYYCEHGVRRVLMDDMPDFESMDISKGMDSDTSDTESEDEGNRRSKRRSG